ncbi:MAG: ABC transporter ATP-binding protein [Verrucomicrobiales bacterium]|nr:ABC transporter ATP-binding protein [Verrucomicrobiales bacterium]
MPSEAPPPALEALRLTRTYPGAEDGVPALNGVSLTLARGDFAAVTGPSGCGKSTLLQLCGAMDRPDAGQLRLDGTATEHLSEVELTRLRRERIGFVFQFFNLLPTLTVLENIALPLRLAGQKQRPAELAATQLAERVGISHRLRHLPAQISGGEAQRAAVARAVIHRPRLLIADEPTGSLDSDNGRRILQLLTDLNTELGIAILLATHDPSVAAAASRHLPMKDGRFLESHPPLESAST